MTDAELQMLGFQLHRKDRGRREGGVLAYVSEDIKEEI